MRNQAPAARPKNTKLILAIETSCDETSAAVLEFPAPYKLKAISYKLLSHVVSSQVKLHAKYGGVVPMLAAREQQKNIEPVLSETLDRARLKLQDIDYFAVTRGPGLIPSLHVGVNYARAIAYAMARPLLGINHLEGHMYSNWLPVRVNTKYQITNSKQQRKSISEKTKNSNHFVTSSLRHNPAFPILNLIVSGGHTELVLMAGHGKYRLIGETLDDAAGEAFDKVARMLHLPYPGGPALASLAEKGNPKAFDFPRPMLSSKNFDFSFSGLKTAVLYKVQDLGGQVTKYHSDQVKGKIYLKNIRTDLSVTPSLRHYIPDLCASFEQAAVDVLVEKTLRAAKRYKTKGVFISGGVSANKKLRETFAERIAKELPGVAYGRPELAYTGDNAAMIAMAAYWKLQSLRHSVTPSLRHFPEVTADANLQLDGK